MEIPLSPLALIKRSKRLYLDREAVVDGQYRANYLCFFERCNKWSNQLQQLGIMQGDRVAYIAPNSHQHLEGYYAVPQVGAIIVPINYRLNAADFVYILNHCGAKILCVDASYKEMIDEISDQLTSVEHFVILNQATNNNEIAKLNWLDYEACLKQADENYQQPSIKETDIISINYTSGTTARPKGVMLTHRNAYLNILGTLANSHLTADESYLWTVPMFHVNGWCFAWTVTVLGAKHVCLPKVDPKLIFELMVAENVSLFCAAPTVLISIVNASETLDYDLPRDIQLFTAGAAPAAATIYKIEHDLGWKIIHVYGLTETSPFLTICEMRAEHSALSLAEKTKFKARQGIELYTTGEIKVVDDHGNHVAKDGNAIGEIIVRGNPVMLGYYNDEEATDRAIQDGWFHTGDAAVMHPDGYIEVKDRFKDVIISGGENISSLEVESALLNHPQIHEVGVVGMAHEKWGEAPHAFVVLKDNAMLTEDQVIAFAREQLAHFKIPQKVTFIKELPKTATGKIQKYILRDKQSAVFRQ